MTTGCVHPAPAAAGANWLQVLIGGAALAVGALVYLVDRAPEHTQLLLDLPFRLSLQGIVPPIFGPLAGSAPAFAHCFAFGLLTTGLLACGRRAALGVCVAWMLVNAGFELGQRFPGIVEPWVPAWFDGRPVLRYARTFFRRGTFDTWDLAAAVLGCAAAYATVLLTTTDKEDDQ